jgi:hypothetical protein
VKSDSKELGLQSLSFTITKSNFLERRTARPSFTLRPGTLLGPTCLAVHPLGGESTGFLAIVGRTHRAIGRFSCES